MHGGKGEWKKTVGQRGNRAPRETTNYESRMVAMKGARNYLIYAGLVLLFHRELRSIY